MELHDIINKNFNLKPIIKIEKTENGSGSTYIVETEQGKYISKTNERIDFANIYEKVQGSLNQIGLLQSKIIKTIEGLIMTSEGLILYDYIEGNNYKTLTQRQTENSIKYIKKYNKALNLVPFKNDELDLKNHWDKSKSIDFLTNEFPNYISKLDIGVENKKNIYDAINILSRNKGKLLEQKKQLIHSDLGADNFIFKDDEIISIIDFTPEYNHELYSLCQFIYWNYLWQTPNISIAEINNYLRIYNSDENTNYENDIFYLLLINAAVYRIAGVLIDNVNKNIKKYEGLMKRFIILSELLINLK